jgi:hypothetical protein
MRIFEIYDNDGIDDDIPWSTSILAAVEAAVRSTHATMMQTTPMQIFYGRDAVIRNRFSIAEWDYIRQRNRISYNIIIFKKTRSVLHLHIQWEVKSL